MEIAPVTFRATQSHANAARDHGHAPPPPGTANRPPQPGTPLLNSPNAPIHAPDTAPPPGSGPALHAAPPPPSPVTTTTISPQAQALAPPAPSTASDPVSPPTAHSYSSLGEPLPIGGADSAEGGQIDVRA